MTRTQTYQILRTNFGWRVEIRQDGFFIQSYDLDAPFRASKKLLVSSLPKELSHLSHPKMWTKVDGPQWWSLVHQG